MGEDELYKIYEAHRNQGASHDEAMQAVQMAQEGKQAPDAELAAQKRLSASGGSAAGDFGRMAAQGATFGFGDELAGLLGGDTEKSRQRIADLRQLAPGASTMAEMAGASALPIGAGGEAMRAGGGMLKGAAAGALGGAVQGGASGMGEATGSVADRLPSAERGALVGAAIGAPLGAAPAAVNAFMRGSKGAPARLADLLRNSTGIKDDLYTATQKAAAQKAEAGAALGALDAANPVVSDPNVLAALDRDRFVKKAVRAVEPGGFGPPGPAASIADLNLPPMTSPEDRAATELQRRIAKLKESGQPIDADQIGVMYQQILGSDPLSKIQSETIAQAPSGGRAPSLADIRTVRQELKDAAARAAKKPRTTLAQGYQGARNALTEATDAAVPGFKDANRAYAQASSLEQGLGTKSLANKTGDELKIMLEGQYPEMQQGMRTRLVNDIGAKLNTGNGGAWLTDMVQKKPEILGRLRNLFPEDDAGSAAFQKLLDELSLEQSAAKTRKVALPLAIGAGVGTYGLSHLLSGS